MAKAFEFYAGDHGAIADMVSMRFEGCDDFDESCILARAAFRVHEPNGDIVLLADVIVPEMARPDIEDDKQPATVSNSMNDLADNIDIIVSPGGDCYLMRQQWVDEVAKLSASRIEELAKTWRERCFNGFDDTSRPSLAEIVKGMSDMLHVCRTAVEKSVSVVYTWIP